MSRRERTVGGMWCTVGMAYVHGHARRLGWVVGHYRRPQRPGAEQLALALSDAVLAIPAPRVSPEAHARRGGASGVGMDQAASISAITASMAWLSSGRRQNIPK